LWAKVKRGLSAGRVQSVAVRLICEREDEINAFKPEEYWTIEADLTKDGATFVARLVAHDGTTLKKLDIKNKEQAESILDSLKNATYTVSAVTKKEKKKYASPPFTTSTLQQASFQKLGYSAKRTMIIAQQLYEGVELAGEGQTGLITYMRTDSLNLAQEAVSRSRDFISKEYGADFLPEAPRFFKTKSKGAQEAHEAIRPTDPSRTPDSIKNSLSPEQFKLYSLIWARMVASQMNPAIVDATTVDITANKSTFRANGQIVRFPGYLKVYNDAGAKGDTKEVLLPELAEHDTCELNALRHEQHATQPPARYNEAALVKKLEELGIGRPSTYAPIMTTIQDRGYVEKEEKKFKPTEIGTLVNKILTEHFASIVDYEFTAEMEKNLDEVAEGTREWVPVIRAFYDPFKKNLAIKDKELSKKELTEEATDMKCEKCGKPMVIKMGRFGKFYACTGYPECKNTKPLKEEVVPEEYQNVKCPKCGKPMVVKRGRFGSFLGCSDYPNCKTILPMEKKIGVKCPKCGEGEIIEKRSRRGKVFFACNRYPKCDQSFWQKPTGEKCPDSGDLLVFAAKGKVRCSNKECGFTKTLEQ
jgi:DNA topoisomerase-1